MSDYQTTIDPLYYTAGYIHGFILASCTILGIVALILRKEPEPVRKLVQYSALALALSASIVFSAYVLEIFYAYFWGAKYEMEAFKIRITGPYWWAYVYMMVSNGLPVLLWWPKVRSSIWAFTLISFFGLSAMYFERLTIILTTMMRS